MTKLSFDLYTQGKDNVKGFRKTDKNWIYIYNLKHDIILQNTNKNRARNKTHGSLNKTLQFACITDKHITYIIYYIVICVMSFVDY